VTWQGFRRGGLPLAVMASGVTASAALLVLLIVAVGLAIAGRPLSDVGWLVALVVGLTPAGVAGFAARRISRSLGQLNDRTTTRLERTGRGIGGADGSATADSTDARRTLGVLAASLELDELLHTLESLQVRVRVSDEMAERQRRTAENASAGMYELLSGLVAAEEATRGQLSAELHDTAAQSLMLARSLLADVLDQMPDAPAQLSRATDYVGEAEDQVRAVMARTRPPALRDGDLARAVGHLRDDMASRYGLVVTLSWPQQPYPLSLVSAITVYRFFQEALLNVVKHADGDEADATLEMTEQELTATVVDAGPGFDPALVKPDKGRHVGLGLLRERARLAGGSLTVTSTPGGSTTLCLRLPRTAAQTSPFGGRLTPATEPVRA
jgi:signal transduction histidine kinase